MAGRPSYGWKSFCGILLMIVGVMNVIDGLVAITRTDEVASHITNELPLTTNVKTWGWVVLVIGIFLIMAGSALSTGATWARVVGILVASANLIVQVGWVAHNSFWSFTAIVINLIVIYGIAVHCGKDDELLV